MIDDLSINEMIDVYNFKISSSVTRKHGDLNKLLADLCSGGK